jgi:glucose dehydrogenase
MLQMVFQAIVPSSHQVILGRNVQQHYTIIAGIAVILKTQVLVAEKEVGAAIGTSAFLLLLGKIIMWAVVEIGVKRGTMKRADPVRRALGMT